MGMIALREDDDMSLNDARVRNYDEWDYPVQNQTGNNMDEAKKLLKEARDFMNLVPNKKYGDNYKICAKITKFLK